MEHQASSPVVMAPFPSLLLSEPKSDYDALSPRWVEVLVDCPGSEQKLYTYLIPSDLTVQVGAILVVPFGPQLVGGVAIRLLLAPPPGLDTSRIKEVIEVVTASFFPGGYWDLLNRVADYYCTELITVIHTALPPGLLGRSQRRLKLNRDNLPEGAEVFCSRIAQQVLTLLKAQKEGDYSYKYLQREIRGAQRGIRELMKRGWIESYLEAPKITQAQFKKAVILVRDGIPPDASQPQRDILEVLRRKGGEVWLSELSKLANTSESPVHTLEKKGYLVIELREKLRLSSHAENERESAKTLTTAQQTALGAINSLQGYELVLLHGVTGSGKTEVYLQAIARILALGKSALVLVPEIGLTPQLTERFSARFGTKVLVYHSALSDGERYDTWRQTLTGESQVIIGTRSAIFAPLRNLGIIILDEEHDSSFKQTHLTPTYHARTVAQWRAQLENCPLILGSATPALETWIESQKPDKYYLSLPERIQARPLPPVEIVDMRQELQQGNRSIFSRSLQSALSRLREQKKQGILFINRRGHSTFVSCRNCGYVIECPDCDVSLSYHYTQEGATELLRCHYCNHTKIHPQHCPECGSPYLKFFGSGTQRVTQELTQQFPNLRWLRFDSDTTRRKNAHREILGSFSRGDVDVLVGTQMLTKGLDIAQVTLVGVVSADGLLHHSDYRASERAFQTLTQVAGRAGRGDDPGQVIVQTYSPEHSVINAVRHHDYQGFINTELPQRQSLGYPPYGRLVLIRLSGIDEAVVQNCAELLGEHCLEWMDEMGEVLGPAPAAVMRVARRYRWQILLKFLPTARPHVRDLLGLGRLCPPSVSMGIDVDPLSID
jgi:primosomal protein N' (replication factor Y)